MQIIKKAIQDEINAMSHEPEPFYCGSWYCTYPEINWENVYERALDEFEQHISVEDLPDDIYLVPKELLEKEIEHAKTAQWVQDMLDEARQGYQERVALQENPYKVYGVSRYDI